MKVLGISVGRRNGNSEILLKHALKAIEEEGIEVSYFRLHDYEVKPCTGCEYCTKFLHAGVTVSCSYPDDADDYKQIIKMIEESDGYIIAAPAYHLMPPGILNVILNRSHGAALGRNPGTIYPERRVCATIGVGGSDWTSLFMPIMNFAATEMMGSKMVLVDQMKIHRTPAIGMILCNKEALERATLLGKNVAAELKKDGPIEYRGEEGMCPVCHNSIMVVRNGRFACAICDYEGDPIIEDGKIKSIKWDGGIEITRWSKFGMKHHDEEKLANVELKREGYVFTEEQKKTIEEGRALWGKYLEPVMPTRK